MNSNDTIFPRCDQVRETAYALHRFLRHGHFEKVYENGLAHRLRHAGVKVISVWLARVARAPIGAA
jgi:hypothetical protein